MTDVRIRYGDKARRMTEGETLTIGRGRDMDLMVTEPGASRRHAQLRRVGDRIEVIDLGSSNGTFVDGARITGPQQVGHNGRIQLGDTTSTALVVESAATGRHARLPQSGPMPKRQPAPGAGPTGPTQPRGQAAPAGTPAPSPQARRLPATSSVPRSPSHTGVVFDRYELQQAMAAAPPGGASATAVQGAAPQVVAQSMGGPQALSIGRGLDNTIVVDDLLVSRHHTRLHPRPNGFEVEDLNSRNGTYVNGQRISRGHLGEGDFLAVGHSRFTVLQGQLVASLDEGDVNFVANHLSFTLDSGKSLLDDISFALEGSSLLAVIGPSGAGKSTLLKALTGSQRATQGEVYYDGRDLYENFDDLRHRIGVVPQDDVVHRQLTVRQALRYAAELRFPDDLDKSLREQRVEEVMQELDLGHHGDTRVDKLSGGQRKRTSVALELLTRPSLLFLDEPTSGLDPGLDKQVMQTLRGLADGGRTVVVVTHSVANLGVCDKVLLLAPGGSVAYFGPPDKLLDFFGFQDHADVFTAVAKDPKGSQARFRNSPMAVEQIDAPLRSSRRPNAPLEKPPRQQSIASQLSTLARRHARVILADRGYTAFTFLLPIALAIMAMIVPGKQGLALPDFAAGEQGKASEPLSLLVVIIVGALFMGTATSIRELVGERAIYTREKAVGLSPAAYLWGKLTIFGLVTLVQSSLLVLITLLVKKAPSEAVMLGSPTAELILTCWFTAFSAMALGLLLSSIVKTSEQVMPLLVLTVMAQLVLCGGLFPVDGRPVMEQLSWLTPGRWGYAAAAGITDVVNIFPNGQGKQLDSINDPLWTHSPGYLMLALGMLLVLTAIFAVVTQVRLSKTKD